MVLGGVGDIHVWSILLCFVFCFARLERSRLHFSLILSLYICIQIWIDIMYIWVACHLSCQCHGTATTCQGFGMALLCGSLWHHQKSCRGDFKLLKTSKTNKDLKKKSKTQAPQKPRKPQNPQNPQKPQKPQTPQQPKKTSKTSAPENRKNEKILKPYL